MEYLRSFSDSASPSRIQFSEPWRFRLQSTPLLHLAMRVCARVRVFVGADLPPHS